MDKPLKPLSALRFNAVKTTKRKSTTNKKLSKLVYCICQKDKASGEFRAHCQIVGDPHRTILSLPFSLASYNLKGKIRVFSIKPDKMNKIVCYIRSATEAMRSGPSSKIVTAFCHDWVYSGHIVRIGNNNYFDIKEAISHKEFFRESLEINIKDVHL